MHNNHKLILKRLLIKKGLRIWLPGSFNHPKLNSGAHPQNHNKKMFQLINNKKTKVQKKIQRINLGIKLYLRVEMN